MDNQNLYNSSYVANNIKKYAKLQNVSLKSILENCELGSNTFSHMLHGKIIAYDSLARIADFLNCSVDFLLGRTDQPNIGSTETCFSKDNHMSVTSLSCEEKECLEKFSKLKPTDQGRILERMEMLYNNYPPEEKEDVS